VRRAEARRFREGEAEVLVATDAIGMGLNIGPLRRVVFSSLTKWDGKQDRPLSVQEIKQIGGRAGRFGGAHVEGIVAVLERGGSPAEITHALTRAAWRRDDRAAGLGQGDRREDATSGKVSRRGRTVKARRT
jgi:ATP-dependent RNA helicase SUPV3L1/SUV3